ncbi:MAG TPA: MFS transporter [Candidatus Binataceae bacterium]|nr:MFS transporter [Candidatus Binataceae bacterium]
MFTAQTAGGAARSDEAALSSSGHTPRQVLVRYCGIWSAYSIASGFLFGVYPIFLHARGLNQFQMDSVLAIYFAVTFLTDVPTGAFADALGRRRSFMLGCSLRAVAFLVYFFAYHYPMFLLGEFIDGIGTTFCNGSIDAWGVDALDDAGYKGLKDRLFWRISQLMNLGFMISAVIGSYIADWNIAWPWLFGAIGYLINAVFIARLMHEKPHQHSALNLAAMPSLIRRRVVDGLRQGFAARTLFLLSLANGIFFAAWAPYWLEWPQFFNQSYGSGVWVVGWIYGLFTITRMIGAEVMIQTSGERAGRPKKLIVMASALALLMYLGGSSANHTTLALIIFSMLNACMGAVLPFVQSWVNEEIRAEQRATLLSFRSTFETMGGSIGLLITGIIADRAGIPTAWQFAGVLTLVTLPCYWALHKRIGIASDQASDVA